MSKLWKTIEESTTGPLEPGQMLVGYRFEFTELDLDDAIRLGTNRSFVTRRMPISGPIFFQFNHRNITKPEWIRYMVVCAGCRERKYFKTRSQKARTWAHNHRCKFRWEFENLAL